MLARRVVILLFVLRLVLGLFWMDHGLDKVSGGWLTQDVLKPRLERNLPKAAGLQKVFLEHFAVPASGALHYLVTLGEIAIGISFLVGFWMKPASWGAILMVLSFKLADGRFQSLDVFGDAYLFPLLLAILVVAYATWERKWTIRRFTPIFDRFEID